jgi:hypothetical protein
MPKTKVIGKIKALDAKRAAAAGRAAKLRAARTNRKLCRIE